MVSRIALFAVLVLALPVFGTDTERKVKVALALAEPAPKTAAKPAAKGKLDWFGEGCTCCKAGTPCTCKPGASCGGEGCPGACAKTSQPAKAKEYTTVYVQECSVDQFGRKTCQWVARQVEKK